MLFIDKQLERSCIFMKKLISIFLLFSLVIHGWMRFEAIKNSEGDDSGSSKISGSVSKSDAAAFLRVRPPVSRPSRQARTIRLPPYRTKRAGMATSMWTGNGSIAPQYDMAYPFSNGVATVQPDSRKGAWQIIDKEAAMWWQNLQMVCMCVPYRHRTIIWNPLCIPYRMI